MKLHLLITQYVWGILMVTIFLCVIKIIIDKIEEFLRFPKHKIW